MIEEKNTSISRLITLEISNLKSRKIGYSEREREREGKKKILSRAGPQIIKCNQALITKIKEQSKEKEKDVRPTKEVPDLPAKTDSNLKV